MSRIAFQRGRRDVLAGAIATAAVAGLSGISRGTAEVLKEIHDLKPGEFVWHPERSPEGSVSIIVSIPDQRVHVYRNGIRIGVSTCSTGRKGHETPTGVFTILEKDKKHFSSTYNNAPMPNMNRLTWSGIALHAGKLPGYPASHGCIRLPIKFSELLFGVTHVGTPVILAGSHSEPSDVVHPGLILGDYAEHEFDQALSHLKGKAQSWAPHVTRDHGPAAIVVSSADRTGTLIVDGHVVGQRPVSIVDPDVPLGSHVFILKGTDHGRRGLSWHAIGHHEETGVPVGAPEEAVIRRIIADDDARSAAYRYLHPGMTLVTTDLPSHPETRSGRDFVVMAVDHA